MGEHVAEHGKEYPPPKTAEERRQQRNMWLGLIGPPVIFLINLQVAYMLVDWCCLNNSRLPLHLAPLMFLIICVGCGILANSERLRMERAGSTEGERTYDRTHFMLVMGATVAILCTIGIAGQWLATFILDPCQP